MSAPASRICRACGATMVKPPALRNRDWLKRSCCSRSCAASLARTPARPSEAMPGEFDPSRELLIRLVRYGAKNDGLPGLTAIQFHKLANELGVRI